VLNAVARDKAGARCVRHICLWGTFSSSAHTFQFLLVSKSLIKISCYRICLFLLCLYFLD
jgi:hypothetical protein